MPNNSLNADWQIRCASLPAGYASVKYPMAEIPYAKKKRTSYENFAAQCPWCQEESIFNRASDLNDFSPIAFRTVTCLSPSCGNSFNINGDSVNSAHEMLILDCYELLSLKHYMNCILTVTQAYEVFFSLFLRVELLYKPFAADPEKDINQLNNLAKKLAKKIERYPFWQMRALFLRQITCSNIPKNVKEAKEIIEALCPCEPRNTEIESLGDEKLIALTKALKSAKVNELRNKIVHKQAYRPTQKEAESALKKARSILFPLSKRLGLYDDINWYMPRKNA